MRSLALLLLTALFCATALAQSPQSPSTRFDFDQVAQSAPAAAEGLATPLDRQVIARRERQERIAFHEFIIATVAMLIALTVVLWTFRHSTNRTADHLVMASGLILIIYGAVAVLLVADTHEQLTAPIGIFGALAGYLFGRSRDRNADSNASATNAGRQPSAISGE